MTPVYIVDDDPEVRKFTSWLVQELGYSNHPFVSAADFIEALPHLTPGCLLVDLRMEEMGGIELLEAISDVRASFPAVLMTGYADVENVVSAMKAGAVDVLQKPVTIERLAEVLTTTSRVLEPAAGPSIDDSVPLIARDHDLTERQTDVLRCLVAGRANKQIAADLAISTRTVEMHRAAVMAKLGVHSLPALLRAVIKATVRPAAARQPSTRAQG